MKKYSLGIHYNGKWYDKNSIIAIDTHSIPAWEKDHFDFLKNWMNDSPFVDVQTSGSTGTPKTIQLPKSTMASSAKMTCTYLGINRDDNALLCLPSRFIGGKMMLVRAMVMGLKLWAIEPGSALSPGKFFRFSAMTPHQLSSSLVHDKNLLEKFEILILGGSSTSKELIQLVSSTSCTCYSTYGMTETSSHIALQKLNGVDKDDYFVTIDPSINISSNKDDCLVISAPYLGKNQINTKDIVEIIDHHHFRIKGRKGNVINSGGIKIQAEKIEEKLNVFFPFKFIIFGTKNEIYGERPSLLIESGSTHEIDLILMVLQKKLSSIERPDQIFTINKMMLTENGKINRNQSINKAKFFKTV